MNATKAATKLKRSMPPRIRLGIDTGGTFTDFIAILHDPLNEPRQLMFKVASTPHAPEQAILQGITRVLAEFALPMPPVLDLAHGTTVATNALLERKGARTALLTTAGFTDVLEIGRQARPDPYNFAVTRPAPLVPTELRFGVCERIAADGSILEPLTAKEITRVVKQLKQAEIEAIAVSLLFAFANPAHEQALAKALAPLGIPLSLAHEILPEYREYERTSTIVINAYLAPKVSQYLQRLTSGLADLPVASQSLRIMQSSGGSISASTAAREPVRTILSGPAGGVIAATRIAELAGQPNIITFDMGGTSTDVALIAGAPATTSEAQIIGLPVAVPILDIHTVGAGGGSLAYVDAGGALRVGPASAGADPGPACYGKGTQATVTDANCVLGRFAGTGLLNGTLPLAEKRAFTALQALANALSAASRKRVTPQQAALGVVTIANANMERALRLVSIERGHDPRRFTLVGFGGAGGLHVAALATSLRIPRVLIPQHPGAFSALGVLLADVVKDYSRTVMLPLPPPVKTSLTTLPTALPKSISATFAQLEKQARADLRAEGFTRQQIQLSRTLALRYRGQSFELEIPAQPDFSAAFHRAHRERYGHADESRSLEIVSLRLRATGLTDKPALTAAAKTKRHAAKPLHSVPVYLTAKAQPVPVYQREQLSPGASLNGPALIREYGSMTLVPSEWRAEVDSGMNLLLQWLP